LNFLQSLAETVHQYAAMAIPTFEHSVVNTLDSVFADDVSWSVSTELSGFQLLRRDFANITQGMTGQFAILVTTTGLLEDPQFRVLSLVRHQVGRSEERRVGRGSIGRSSREPSGERA